MDESLKRKTIHALYWNFLGGIGGRIVQFAVGISLARLLFPDQFGLMAMLTIFIAVAMSLVDAGFWAALIQKKDITAADTSSIFYFNIAVGALVSCLLCLLSSRIAQFYKQPILTPLTQVMSITVFIGSIGAIQGSILTKNINFKFPNKISLVSGVLSGFIAVGLALLGFGVWSLAVQQVANALFQTMFLWVYSPWRPEWIFRVNALRELFRFGSRMFISGLLTRIFDNVYSLVIGKFFSATDLGFYTRAKAFQGIPSQTLAETVGLVTIPVFSTIQDEPERIKRGLRKALTILGFANFPIMIGVYVTARPLVLALLTGKWAASIPYLKLLCFVGLLYPLEPVNMNVLIALGRSDLFLRLEAIKKILITLNVLITWRYGITTMIYGMIAISFTNYIISCYYNKTLINYSFNEQIKDLLSYFMLSIAMGIIVYLVGLFPFPNNWTILFIQITTGIAVYIGFCRIFRLEVFMEIWKECCNRINFRVP